MAPVDPDSEPDDPEEEVDELIVYFEQNRAAISLELQLQRAAQVRPVYNIFPERLDFGRYRNGMRYDRESFIHTQYQ